MSRRGARRAGLWLAAFSLPLCGCASLTVSDGVLVQRLSLPGLSFVTVRVEPGVPVAVESRGIGVTISPTGAHLGALTQTVARLPNDGACRVVVLERPRTGLRNQATDFCSMTPGGS